MAHIAVNEQLPGIVGLLHFRPETAAHHYGGDLKLIDEIKAGLPNVDLSPPQDHAAYDGMGRMLAFEGYTQATPK